MGAGTDQGKYGLASGHAYSVLRAHMTDGGVRAVECFNPWGHDKYDGQLPNKDKTDGKFSMTLNEFFDAFTGSSCLVRHSRVSFQYSDACKELICLRRFYLHDVAGVCV